MKKITLFAAAVAVLASCNREDALTTQSGNGAVNLNVKNFEKSELQNMITPMSQSFGFNGKASATQVNFMYRGWAEPVKLDLTLSGIEGTSAVDLDATKRVVDLSASAAWAVNDMVFVVWHAVTSDPAINSGSHNVNRDPQTLLPIGPLVGGSITAYKQSGIGQYEFMDRVDFYDADYHEIYGDVDASSGNFVIMMAGQRAMNTSGYLLAGHNGAVVTRMDYDYINDEFWEGSFREIPLPGVSANDIVGAARRFYVTTGGGIATTGNVFELEHTLTNVVKIEGLDGGFSGRALAIDNRLKGLVPATPTPTELNTDALYVLSANGLNVNLNKETVVYNPGSFSTDFALTALAATGGPIALHSNLERADLTIASSDDNPFTAAVDAIPASDDRIFATIHSTAVGAETVYNVNGAVWVPVPNIGNAISTEYDAGLDVLYAAMGGNGAAAGIGKAIKVIALSKFADLSPVINEYDVVGEFADPALTGVVLSDGVTTMSPTIGDVKEITIYGSRNITLAAGSQGVYFIQRDAL
jgi:hypothetical protein